MDVAGSMDELELTFQNAVDLRASGDTAAAETAFQTVIRWKVEDSSVLTDASKKALEQSTYILSETYLTANDNEAFKKLFFEILVRFDFLPKARTAKIVKNLLDLLGKQKDSHDLQEEMCETCVKWCEKEMRTFLRHRVQTRLAVLYHTRGKYTQCLNTLSLMLHEVKKLNDNLLLVEIHLLESKLYFSVKNVAKSKAALTASRTHANAIHCPPLLQAEIDLQSGVLHAEEKDFRTSYSYFYEAFEAFHIADDPRAIKALKCMLLAKVMCNKPAEVAILLGGKNVLAYSGRDIDALSAVAKSCLQRSLQDLEKTLEMYSHELKEDEIIQNHISDLHENMLEQNLLRILGPYERVEIHHIAKQIHLPEDRVLIKLGEMILDNKLLGTIDQGSGVVIVFDKPPLSPMYQAAVETFRNLTTAVDALHRKAQAIA
eukprot:Lankesteria_metandrocarpae@DN2818_c0_g1_i1.p1